MENYSFENYFREDMTSEEASYIFWKLMKTIPENQRETLSKVYHAIADKILRRECEQAKKFGIM